MTAYQRLPDGSWVPLRPLPYQYRGTELDWEQRRVNGWYVVEGFRGDRLIVTVRAPWRWLARVQQLVAHIWYQRAVRSGV